MLKPVQVADCIERLSEYAIESGISDYELLAAVRKRYYEIVLDLEGHNQCSVARRLHVHRNTLARTLKHLGIEVKGGRRNRRRSVIPVVNRMQKLSEPVNA